MTEHWCQQLCGRAERTSGRWFLVNEKLRCPSGMQPFAIKCRSNGWWEKGTHGRWQQKGAGQGRMSSTVAPSSLPWGSVGSARLILLQPRSLLAQLPEAVTQRGRFLPVPRYLRNFSSPFYKTPTDTKAESGCWGSEAHARAAASHSLFAALQSLLLSASICGSCPRPRHRGEEANPNWDGSSL